MRTMNPRTHDGCPTCKDTGWLVLDAYPGDSGFGELVECPCKLPTRRRCEAWDLMFRVNGWVPDKTFASWSLDEKVGHKKRVAAAIGAGEYARNYRKRWLVLSGVKGSGKTHLAAAITNSVRASGEAACFVNAVRLIEWFKRTLQDTDGRRVTFSEALEQIKLVPVLVLDDLGAERETDWTREVLYSLLNDRYDWRLSTVVTTNADAESLDPRIASRLRDRGLVTVVDCGDVDYRRLSR